MTFLLTILAYLFGRRPAVVAVPAAPLEVDPEYAHLVGADEYPTGRYPAYAAARLHERGLAVELCDQMRWTSADLAADLAADAAARQRAIHEIQSARTEMETTR